MASTNKPQFTVDRFLSIAPSTRELSADLNPQPLDQDTTATQIIPYLNTLNTKTALEDYLQTLLGPGLEQTAFIRQIVSDRFPNRLQPTAFPSLKASNVRPTSTSSSSSSKTGPHQYRNPDHSSRLSPAPNRSIRVSPIDQPPPPTQDWSSQFGSSGNVYVKDRGTDQNQRIKKGKNVTGIASGQSISAGPSTFSRPSSTPGPTQPQKHNQEPQDTSSSGPPVSQANPQHASIATADILIPLSGKSLEQLYHLERILNSLRLEPQPVSKSTPHACFCLGRVHELPTSPLPNLCTYCGMIYCRLKLPLAPCPSCLRVDQVWSNANLKAAIVTHFERQKEELIETELRHHRQAELRLQQQAEMAKQAERAFPSLGLGGLQKRPGANEVGRTSYVNHLTGGPSIEERIRAGYQNLANAGDEVKKKQQAEKDSSSRTVLRLDSKSGKTKIVTTTTSTKKDGKIQTAVQERNLALMKEIEAGDQSTGLMDEWDDGQRLARGLEPVLAIPFGNVRHRPLNVVAMPEYIPPSIYQHDG
ncbi:hypothetical protein CROQUDRAFT_90195 [Cronartium quercuum f. sp. fusiforme G11]|uniref:TRIP4/RQT4 C2HC5-type zinc finger domain-containing protein n=1 Tax=Cronartium quercuum f. sp. fusiforme G11 TaxID=708437 RepID=A0A9P6NMW6_9BASI|nr:hypothetical protein CROQUDRAFT_90195 [Cronartium quercuum f. sp. fusiforme G11]